VLATIGRAGTYGALLVWGWNYLETGVNKGLFMKEVLSLSVKR